MNGGENGFAGALFFSLITVGVVLKVDDVIGWGIGVASALVAAICLRQALTQAAMAREEDHQRVEIQFQQLRHKIVESSTAARSTMQSMTEIAEGLQENLRLIDAHLSELQNLTDIAETSSAIGAVVREMKTDWGEISAALKNIEKLSAKNLATTTQQFNDISAKLNQLAKNPDFTGDLKKIALVLNTINVKMKNLSELKIFPDEAKVKLEEIVTVGEKIFAQNQLAAESAKILETTITNSAESFQKLGGEISSSAESNAAAFEDVRRELATLAVKLDAVSGLMKVTLEQYSNLTAQDIRILEKISERANGK